MKKILIISTFICLSVASFGQTKQWNDTITVTTGKTDSVFWPEAPGDIAAFPWSITFVTVGMTDTIWLDIGGSNIPIDTSVVRSAEQFAFEGFINDSLPYVFTAAKNRVITNGDTTYQKTFIGSDPYGMLRPAFSLTTGTDTVFTLKIYGVFSK